MTEGLEGLDETPTQGPVKIRVLNEGMRLYIEPQAGPLLEPHQDVVWEFENVPEGWVPFILFYEGSENHLGPFQALHQTQNQVMGTGNHGRAGKFRYRAIVRDAELPRMNLLVSPGAELLQGASAVIDVSVDLEQDLFVIEPIDVKIDPGQTVLWRFLDLDPNYIPEICFYERRNRKGKDKKVSYFGPFNTLSYVSGGVSGEGEGDPQKRGKFSYYVDVTSVFFGKRRRILKSYNSEDPFIDNDPDPVWELDQKASAPSD